MADINSPADQAENNVPDNQNQAPPEVESKRSDFPEDSALMSLLEWIHTLLTKDSKWPHQGLSFREALAAAETSFDSCPQAAKFAFYDSLDDPEVDSILATFASSSICDRLKLVFQHPQLVMEVGPNRKRSLLHAFVAVSSQDGVQKLLNVVLSSDRRLEYLHTKEAVSGFTAYEMARIVGNGNIAEMIVQCADGNVVSPPLREATATATARIGEVLRLHLEPLGFSDLPLKIRGLGDEFRLHVSLLPSDPATRAAWANVKPTHVPSDPATRAAWANVKPTHVHYLMRIVFEELHGEMLLPTFLSLRDAAGRNIFHYMMDLADEGIFRTLMHVMEDHVRESSCGHLLEAKDAVGRTPLHLAAARGHVARVELMHAVVPSLDFNATFRVSGSDGDDVEGVSPLCLAIAHNQYAFVKYLLSVGKVDNPNERIVFNKFQLPGRFGSSRTVRWTPVQLSAFFGHSRIAEKLISDDRVHVPCRVYFREGEKPIAEDKLLDTAPPLHLASFRGKPSVARRLLGHAKTSLLHQDMAGNTALHYAHWHCPDHRVLSPWMFTSMQECVQLFSKQGSSDFNIAGCVDELKEAATRARVDLDRPNISGAKPEPIAGSHKKSNCSSGLSWRATNYSGKKIERKDVKSPSKSYMPSCKYMEDPLICKYTRALDGLDMSAPSEWLESLIALFEMALHSPSLVMDVSPKNRRTLLQMAVVANSVDLVTKVLMMVNDQLNSGIKVVDYFNKSESMTSWTAMDMASVIANPEVVHVMETYQNLFNATRTSGEKFTPGDVQSRDLSENVSVAKVLARFPTLPCPVLPEELQRRTENLGISLGDDFFRQDLRLHTSLMLNDPKVRTVWEELVSPPDVDPKPRKVALRAPKVVPRPPPKNICSKVASLLTPFMRTGASEKVAQPPTAEQPSELDQHGPISGLLNDIISEMGSALPDLLDVCDKAGRHLLHYLANLEPGDGTPRGDLRDTIFNSLMEAMVKGGHHLDMNVRDNAGRTPLHVAAAQGFTKRVEFFANHPTTDLNATFSVRSLSAGAAFQAVHNISALSLAATHSHSEVVKALLAANNSTTLNVNAPVLKILQRKGPNGYEESCVAWSPLQIASIKGHVQTLTELLRNEQVTHSKMKLSIYHELLEKYGASDATFDKTMSRASPLHLAALGRKPSALATLLESKKTNPSALDDDLNTPLHYAARVYYSKDAYGPWDYVSIEHCKEYAPNKPGKLSSDATGCMNMLLEAGLKMDAKNKHGERAEYHGKLRFDDPHASKKQTAMTAVSVTAAVVAATSFVGPSHDMGGSYDHGAIEMFMFFDTLSFYFAMAAIMLTLIPSLAGQHDEPFRQVKRAQRCLHGAVVLLFASITFLICTFGAASVIVAPERRKQYVDVIASSTALGGVTCFAVFVLFLRGLWRLATSEFRYFSMFTTKKTISGR